MRSCAYSEEICWKTPYPVFLADSTATWASSRLFTVASLLQGISTAYEKSHVTWLKSRRQSLSRCSQMCFRPASNREHAKRPSIRHLFGKTRSHHMYNS